MPVRQHALHSLQQLHDALAQLDHAAYAQPLPVLSANSIGRHTRHILEFYLCLIRSSASTPVNYDARERNHELENNRDAALAVIDSIVASVETMNDEPLQLRMTCGTESDVCNSSRFRELAYNVEHTVHHLALIRIGIEQHFGSVVLASDFGVASSTIKFRATEAAAR